MLAQLVLAAVFKTVEPHGNHVVGGFDSHAFPPLKLQQPGLFEADEFGKKNISRPAHRTSTDSESRQTVNVDLNPRCVVCFRPQSGCYCDSLPSIDNRTRLLILQHSRERGHPFNTARMAHAALQRSELLFGNMDALAEKELNLGPTAGLLFPSPQAKTLTQLPADQRPDQLVIIDGTWSQARSMLRDLPQLDGLPHYKLAPTEPGKYRIRLEPTDTSLSTVEAIVAALRELEPETIGLGELLDAFDQMVQRQLDHPLVGREHYSGGAKTGSTMNVPKALLGSIDSIVVAYGESGYRQVGCSSDPASSSGQAEGPRNSYPRRFPLVWTAQRLGGSGKDCDFEPPFVRFLKPDVVLTDSFLEHLRLTHDSFSQSVSMEQFRTEWREFLRPDDFVAVYNQGTLRLLENAGACCENGIALKSINFDSQRPRRTLSQFVEQNELDRPCYGPELGRGGERLANAVALVNYLRGLI